MEPNTSGSDPSGINASDSCCTMSLEKMKVLVADKLHHYAGKLAETATEHADCSVAQHGKLASEWLEKSADYVRHFDYEETNAKVRNSVKQHPGRALLIAGTAGLVIGAICRRR